MVARRGGGQRLDAADQGVDAGDEIGCGDRLGQIVVRPQAKAADAVGIVVAFGQEDDRRRLVPCPEGLAEREAGFVVGAQRDVENDHVEGFSREGLEGFGLAAASENREVMRFENGLIVGAQAFDVLDQKNAPGFRLAQSGSPLEESRRNLRGRRPAGCRTTS